MTRLLGTTAISAALTLMGCATLEHYPKPSEDLWVRVSVTGCSTMTSCADAPNLGHHKGVLLAVYEDSLVLLAWDEREAVVAIPVRAISTVELYRGTKPSAGSALKGGAAGAVLGALLGGAAGLLSGSIAGDAGDGLRDGVAAGAGTGLAAGTLKGIFEGDEHWKEISVAGLRRLFCLRERSPACPASMQQPLVS